jgi:long-chain acyl-CoA synthetase
MCAAFQARVAERGDEVALRTRGGERELTWRDYDAGVRRLAPRLHGLGLRRGDPLALMLRNRPEFHLVDAAAMHLGAIPFSLYDTSFAEQVELVVRDSGARIAVVEEDLRERVPAERVLTPEELEGVEPTAALDVDDAWQAALPEDPLTLIYAAGDPKAVELTHANVVFAMAGYDAVLGFPAGGDVVSYLPMAHVAGRISSHYFPMGHGFRVTCCPDAREVIACLPEVRPAWFFAVPRIWEELKEGIEAKGGADVRRAIATGDEEALAGLRTQLGLDRAKAVNVAAPTPPEVIEFFHSIGLPLGELWAISETTAIGACNPPGKIKIGTVGPAVPGVQLRLAEDGEIEVRGPCVMPGYRGRPDLTRETFTDDGWLRTGDIGELDAEGYLTIVDRTARSRCQNRQRTARDVGPWADDRGTLP